MHKRLLIIARYTGMRAGDLHEFDWDCLKPDPDDDRFCILTFFQRKVQRWNTKPLLKDDAAHAVVIDAISAQRQDAAVQLGRQPAHLFGVRCGDAEKPLGAARTRVGIAGWCIENRVVEAGGKLHRFRWHSLRHFHGTELALLGHDIMLIRMELGHASPDMSMVYVNQRLRLRKKAVLGKGAGRCVDIKGQVDSKLAELAVRKDAALTVDVPGGLCSMPQQIGEWCEHNRACFECVFFRADIEQAGFFEGERKVLAGAVRRALPRRPTPSRPPGRREAPKPDASAPSEARTRWRPSTPSWPRSRRGRPTVARNANTSGLAASAAQRSALARRRVEDAIAAMRRAGEAVTYKTVAETARVSCQ